jgi:hypothetical protein
LDNHHRIERVVPETLSVGNAHIVIVRGWQRGRVRITPHFRKRAEERDIAIAQVGQTIERGLVCGAPEFCPRHRNWKYRIERRPREGYETLGIIVALDMAVDCDDPLIVLITGYWT